MVCCEACGKQVDFPFSCHYCRRLFCPEHRLPENHNCKNKPVVSAPRLQKERNRKLGTCPKCHRDNSKVIKYNAEKTIFRCWHCSLVYGQHMNFPNRYFKVHRRRRAKNFRQKRPASTIFYQTDKPINMKKGRHNLKKPLVGAVLVAIFLVSIYLIFENSSFSLDLQNILPATPSHDEMVNYALSLINSDRQTNGLQSVTLSSINSGQQQAEEMLKKGYFSHWDMQGYKPYMRYTLAGGQGAVAENCAWQGMTGNILSIDVKSTIKDMEWRMMYDDASSNWGHKDNILNALHNKVSIGIAYDNHNVYFVQDFEDDFVSWSQLSVSNNQVTMSGNINSQQRSIQQIAIYYDNPAPLTVNQLEQAPYNHGYAPGTFVGLVLTGNWQAQDGITITADNWQIDGNSFLISFSLSEAIATNGKGVYTLYVQTGYSTADSLTTYSIWV
jgi:uncharacterized protein YkwD